MFYINDNVSVTFQSVDAISQALEPQNVQQVRQRTLPFAAPLLMRSGMTGIRLLDQPTYTTAYSTATSLPVWVSATVSSDMVICCCYVLATSCPSNMKSVLGTELCRQL